MKGKKMKSYDKEFKISAVKMASEGSSSIAEVARSLGVNPTLLYSWKKKYADDGDKAFIGKGHLTELARVLLRHQDGQQEADQHHFCVHFFHLLPPDRTRPPNRSRFIIGRLRYFRSGCSPERAGGYERVAAAQFPFFGAQSSKFTGNLQPGQQDFGKIFINPA